MVCRARSVKPNRVEKKTEHFQKEHFFFFFSYLDDEDEQQTSFLQDKKNSTLSTHNRMCWYKNKQKQKEWEKEEAETTHAGEINKEEKKDKSVRLKGVGCEGIYSEKSQKAFRPKMECLGEKILDLKHIPFSIRGIKRLSIYPWILRVESVKNFLSRSDFEQSNFLIKKTSDSYIFTCHKENRKILGSDFHNLPCHYGALKGRKRKPSAETSGNRQLI